jgi:hypothetical protein
MKKNEAFGVPPQALTTCKSVNPCYTMRQEGEIF